MVASNRHQIDRQGSTAFTRCCDFVLSTVTATVRTMSVIVRTLSSGSSHHTYSCEELPSDDDDDDDDDDDE